MKLSELIQGLEIEKIRGNTDLDIKGISPDSKKVKSGDLFVCIEGFVHDGHDFISEAIEKGAQAVIQQKDLPAGENITTIQVKDSRKALAVIANRFYHFPTQQLKLIGITGTNGKTTVAYMLKAIFEEAHKKVGLLTTVENMINHQSTESKMTTMESIDLQEAFYKMLACDTDYAIMEVSSHSLSLSRVEGCDFDIAVFTNISDEHFEIHKNFRNYLDSKKKLFQYLVNPSEDIHNKKGIINIDEPYASEFMDCLGVDAISYSIKDKSMFHARDIRMNLRNTHFTADTPEGSIEVLLNMSGEYNVYNALAAIAVAVTQGIPLDIIASAFRKFSGAPGRYKILDYGQPYTIIIDFAHNFHGLENILCTLEQFPRNRIITIFGHGGERDCRVRKKMGQVVGAHSDVSIVTADNPRSEYPEVIAREIEKGLQKAGHGHYHVILDRVQAIEYALGIARKDDIVLIAGKGPESKQVYQDRVIYHNDEKVVHHILTEKGSK